MTTATKTADAVDPNEAVQKEVADLIDSVNQGDKIFLRNQLGMTWQEIAGPDFALTVALWKKRGSGATEWQFVLRMTDRMIMKDLGFDLEAAEKAAEESA